MRTKTTTVIIIIIIALALLTAATIPAKPMTCTFLPVYALPALVEPVPTSTPTTFVVIGPNPNWAAPCQIGVIVVATRQAEVTE